jgi:hypothetical protein
MEVFDSEGNKVEGVMTQADFDAKLAAEKTTWEAAQTPAPVVPAADPNAVPEWFKPFADKVTQLSGNQTTMVTSEIAGGLDADKREAFTKRFDSLTGYEETPEGIQRRAQDAYLLAVGQPYQAQSINMQNVAASGGAPTRPSATAPVVDQAFGETFGISDADRSKYGNK